MKALLIMFVATVVAPHLFAQVTVDGSGNLGIGATYPEAALDVSGRTTKFSNLRPKYQYAFGGAADLNWKTIANVTLGTGSYVGVNFSVTVFDAGTNWGHSTDAKKEHYFVRMARSGGAQDDYNDAQVSGPSADCVRIVKTATGAYELQVRQPRSWTRMVVEAQAYAINSLGSSGSITYVDNPSNGSTGGTVYTATNGHTDYFTSGHFSGNVGIGTTSPQGKLDIGGPGGAHTQLNGGNSDAIPALSFSSGGDGTWANSVYGFGFFYSSTDGNLDVVRRNGSTSDSHVLTLSRGSGNVGIGAPSPSHKLEVTGDVRAASFIANSNTYADFVFDEGYDLASLSEVEAHIEQHGHLPDIPSEAEAMEQGINLADFQVKLLQKIEELTLHQIAQEKRLNAQAQQMDLQSERIEQLETENLTLRETQSF